MTGEIPTSLQRRLSYLLGTLYRRSIELETEGLAPLGMGIKQQAALDVLTDEGPMTQQDLGARLGIDRTTIVAVVDGLEGTGLIERARNPSDRRSYLVTPTPAGRGRQRSARRRVTDAERSLLAGLDADERRALTDLLTRAVRAAATAEPATDG